MGAWHYAERHMTSFTLKVVACCCMVVDHIATFIPGMPLWMHWIGRLSSPLFIFLIGWSCEFTHDRKRYLTRLYAAGVLMAFVQGALNIPNNIFTCLFQIALIITLLSADSARDRLRNIALYAAYQLVVIPIFWYVISPLQLPSMASAVIVAASGTVAGCRAACSMWCWACRCGRCARTGSGCPPCTSGSICCSRWRCRRSGRAWSSGSNTMRIWRSASRESS
ncbi:TraX family protein [Bifidobacterium scardovii]|uniref:TraX family protein n=1 Tax=Bifidobacterium scardovii TaxID=158787 RepID=UPI0036F48DD4